MRRRLPPLAFDASAAAKWDRLLTAARAAALAPAADAARLGQAAMKAGKAASIPGQHTRDSEALQLVLLGQRFAGLGADRRAEKAALLAHYADAVAPYLATAKAALTTPRERRSRADLD